MNEPLSAALRGGHERPTAVRYRVLAVLCSLAFLTYLDRICISQVQGDIMRDLRFGELTEEDEARLLAEGKQDDPEARRDLSKERATKRMSWVFSAFLWGYAVFEVPGGWLGDVWGARLVIFRIVVWWSVFTFLTGSVAGIAGLFSASPEPWLLLVAMVLVRFLFGVGEAGAYPNISRAIARWFPFRERASAQGAIWMSSRLGGALAPMAIGLLVMLPGGLGGWQGAFHVLGAVGIIWAVGFVLWFRDRPEEMPSANAAECEIVRSGAAGAGSIYDDAGQHGVPWRRLVLSPNLLAIYMTAFFVSFSWYFYVTFLPRYLELKFDFDYKDSRWLNGLPLLVGAGGCIVGGRISDLIIRRTGSKRWGRSLPGVIGFALAGGLVLLVPMAPSPGWVFLLICLATLVQDMAIPCIWSVTSDVGGRYAGTVGGFMNTVGAVGGALSPLAVAQYGWDRALALFSLSYFAGSLLWLRIDASESIFSPRGRATTIPPP
jgi:MFS family permease